jgi:hypothetical protein
MIKLSLIDAPHIPWKTQMQVWEWKQWKKEFGHTSGVEGCVGTRGWELGRVTSKSIIHTNLHSPNNKLVSAWLEHFWCMDEPRAYMDS